MKIGHPVVDLECEALVRAVRRDDPSGDGLLEALGSGINWPRLIDLSVRHRVMPLLCARLQSLGPQNPAPREIMAGLKTLRRLNEGKNLLLTMKLAKILDAFGSNGVEAIVLKGPALAAAAYGSVGMRQFDDLDILIRPRDFTCVKKLMADLGLRPDKEFTPTQEAALLRRHHNFGFKDAQGEVCIEIHVRLMGAFHKVGLSTEILLAQRESVETEGLKLPSLSAEDALLFLCLHGTNHIWTGLGMVCDVAALVASRSDWAWGKVLDEARKAGLRRYFILGLGLARDALGLELPAEVESRVRADAAAAKLRERILADLLPGRAAEFSYLELALFCLKSKERATDKIKFVLKSLVVLSPTDWEAVHLPDGLYVIYVPLRALRLFAMTVIPGLVKWIKRSPRRR